MENILLKGFNDVTVTIREHISELAKTAHGRLSERIGDCSLELHLKGLHRVDNKAALPKEKYELHARLHVKGKAYTTQEVDYDLIKAVHAVLENIDREVEHSGK